MSPDYIKAMANLDLKSEWTEEDWTRHLIESLEEGERFAAQRAEYFQALLAQRQQATADRAQSGGQAAAVQSQEAADDRLQQLLVNIQPGDEHLSASKLATKLLQRWRNANPGMEPPIGHRTLRGKLG